MNLKEKVEGENRLPSQGVNICFTFSSPSKEETHSFSTSWIFSFRNKCLSLFSLFFSIKHFYAIPSFTISLHLYTLTSQKALICSIHSHITYDDIEWNRNFVIQEEERTVEKNIYD